MKSEFLAFCFQYGGQIVTALIKNRSPQRKPAPALPLEELPPVEEGISQEIPPATPVEDKIEKGIACLPCTNSHLHACVGLLSEAGRMSHDGLTSDGIERVDKCLGEIAAAERIDLSADNIAKLSPEERKIAHHASRELRNIRHDLEGITNSDVLESVTVKMIKLQKYVGNEWFKYRLRNMSDKENQELANRAIAKLKEESNETHQ